MSENSYRPPTEGEPPPRLQTKSRAPTVRSLAHILGLSRTTVADALRGNPRVSKATAKRVVEGARKAGYQANPLVAAMMSDMKRSSRATFRGILAAVTNFMPAGMPGSGFQRALLQGARNRAARLGFSVEAFLVNHGGLTLAQLDASLRQRGIHGLLLLPFPGPVDWTQLDWPRYAGACVDTLGGAPALSRVCCDHERSITDVLVELRARGYRRPGLYLEKRQDWETLRRFAMAFRLFLEAHPEMQEVAPLIGLDRSREHFELWFKRTKPDVVLGYGSEMLKWMENCGARVPHTHGFVTLDTIGQARSCAGLDQQPKELAGCAVEMVIGRLHRNERGLPDWPTTTMLPGRWVEGPTVRLPVNRPGRNPFAVTEKPLLIS